MLVFNTGARCPARPAGARPAGQYGQPVEISTGRAGQRALNSGKDTGRYGQVKLFRKLAPKLSQNIQKLDEQFLSCLYFA
jgi:hypothetical protein